MEQKMDKKEELKELILKKEKEGKVVFATFDGYMEADINEFIKQPTEGLLYDLNRDKVTVLTLLDNPKWVNDYAVGLVISKLKEYYDKINL
jgi:hypothetical protein